MAPRALVTGITGQDGSYLAELLLGKGYEVHGIIRRASTFNTDRIDHLYLDPHLQSKLSLHFGDLTDGGGLRRVLDEVVPDEVYNLGAQSHVRVSFDQPEFTADVVGLGTLRLLEALRAWQKASGRTARIYQAGSSEMFGSAPPRQHEGTAFQPRSPYACAKVHAHYQCVNYRESYGMFICNGILFNHESPRRGETFVTRKISRAATRIKLGLQRKLFLGNLDARRDWGFAGDYVIGTGELHTVREFAELAFGRVGLDWNDFISLDARYLRPAEVIDRRADPAKARAVLGWRPEISFEDLVAMMVDADLAEQRRRMLQGGDATQENAAASSDA